jgi:hypothetical protein
MYFRKFALALLFALPITLFACTPSGSPGAVETAVVQTSEAIRVVQETRDAELGLAVETAIAGTSEADAIQTAVVATQEAAYTPTPPPQLVCAEIADDYIEEVSTILARWSDALEIASSTPRVSLANPLAELQTIRREFSAMEPPPCIEGAAQALMRSMDHVVEGFLLFMQQEPESRVNAEFDEAAGDMDAFSDLMLGIKAEATRVFATREAEGTPTPTD